MYQHRHTGGFLFQQIFGFLLRMSTPEKGPDVEKGQKTIVDAKTKVKLVALLQWS